MVAGTGQRQAVGNRPGNHYRGSWTVNWYFPVKDNEGNMAACFVVLCVLIFMAAIVAYVKYGAT